MIKKIIVSPINNIAAIVHQHKIQELIVNHNTYQVKDIYIGTIQKIFTSINAAFVKLNFYDKSGFIHFNDIKNHKRFKNKYNIDNTLAIQQKVLVQIVKEPTNTKGPRLTTNIHLTGKYVILMPFNNTICITHRIYDENERSFLRALGILIKPKQMGILFKESSIKVNERILIEELKILINQWNYLQKTAIQNQAPLTLYRDNNIIKKIIRDYYATDIASIIIDDDCALKYLCEQVEKSAHYSTSFKKIIKLYKSKTCILEKFNINNTILDALCPKIILPSGVYLFIESYEALTVIDVNSGSFNRSGNVSNTLLKANCLAATEIAYQLKIRNINGIIIVDFIDMKAYKDKVQLLEHFCQILKLDHAKPEIIQISELGLVELTRRRRGQSLLEIFTQTSESTNILESENIVNSDSNVSSIFFKVDFANTVLLNNVNSFKEHVNYTSVDFIPLANSYIMPLSLYYLAMGESL